MRRSFRSQFAEIHGSDFEVVQTAAPVRRNGLPLQNWPVWARFVVLAPIAAALLLLAGLLAFVAFGLAWMFGSALFGPIGGGIIAGVVALLIACAIGVGIASPSTRAL